jgi:hypothetical protein
MESTTKTKVRLTEQDRSDILVTAIEGGIGYWAGAERIDRDEDLNILRADLYDRYTEDEEGEPHTTTCSLTTKDTALDRAMERILDESLCGDWIVQYVRDAVEHDDLGFIDATAADVIVQVAMFGEVIFG